MVIAFLLLFSLSPSSWGDYSEKYCKSPYGFSDIDEPLRNIITEGYSVEHVGVAKGMQFTVSKNLPTHRLLLLCDEYGKIVSISIYDTEEDDSLYPDFDTSEKKLILFRIVAV